MAEAGDSAGSGGPIPQARSLKGTAAAAVLNEVRFTRSKNWLEIDTGKSEPDIVLVNDRRLQVKVAGMFVDGREVRVRAFAVRSEKTKRPMLKEIVKVVGRSSKGDTD